MEEKSIANLLERRMLLILTSLLVVSLFFNLGIYPLFLEEPRRALIALEMLYNNNLLVPTEFGELYYKKPPVWNWVLIFSYKLIGSYSEWSVRFFGVLSYLAMGWMVFWMGRTYVSERFAVYAALFFLTISDGLFYMTTAAGEIDLFYSAITLATFFSIFHFYQKKSMYALFLSAYGLTAIGVLTKGIPSVVFLGFSILIWFIDQKNFKKLFSLAHLSGILLFSIIVGAYFYGYSQYNDIMRYFFTAESSLFAQSADKSFLGSGWTEVLKHFVKFPFENAARLFPASFLLLFLFRKGSVKGIMSHTFIRFCVLVFLANILIYWLSPDSRSRYLYMLYPLVVIVLVYNFQNGFSPAMKKALSIFSIVLLGTLLVAAVLLPFVHVAGLRHLSGLTAVGFGTALALAGFLFLYFRFSQLRMLGIIAAMIAGRIIFDFTVLPLRAEQSDMARKKEEGQEIGRLVMGHPVYLYREVPVSRQRIFYIERTSGDIVGLRDDLSKGDYFLVEQQAFDNNAGLDPLYFYEHKKERIYLVKIE